MPSEESHNRVWYSETQAVNLSAGFAAITLVAVFVAKSGYASVGGGIAALGLSIASIFFALPALGVLSS